ncbi:MULTISPECIES: APC family permease [Streptomyces]|uniref:Amino acid permease n=1 Tax=Streptomyces doudnae TaxID=3075536 RepID=A0ABD5ERR9_9ACTN|nr:MULTISPECIES: amino acid permease [unclassified Streptomyces]MDT0437055.1 amino acid permease [Streptomyces sp. DSM 41981]MYQ67953.1 amino acid permease [Streptomyces sp. SID4950]SCE41716.1 amino acid/polyamine/organocation transporter, APC superfamily [Streptomyces sp. SolWspMP-5a-2]
MTTTEPGPSGPSGHDDAELAEFGYRPELRRSLGTFHTFAAGISYISILTGTFQLFYFGYGSGGPAYWWSWPMVFAGQFTVALCFAELAARYPVAGSVYNWSKKVGNPHLGWLAGWMMLVASIVTIAAVALAYQLTLPQISSFFQFVGDGTGTYDVATNAVVLATVLILFTTLVNAFGVKLMATINTAGVFIELIATVVLIILFAVHITRGPQVVLETEGTGSGYGTGYLGAFLVASLASAYVMYGFDTAASLGEESLDPSRNAPRAIIRAIVASFVLGGLVLLLALMSVSSLRGDRLSTEGLQYVVLNVLGPTAGKAMLWCVLIAVTVCALAVHTAAIRLAFAMARDTNLPASSLLARVSPRFRTPVLPAVIIGVLALAILVVNIRQPQIFTVVTSIGIVMIYLAYLGVTAPMLAARLRGRWRPAGDGRFSLGRWGLPVNVVAVLWGLAMTVNLIWPRAAVYNAAAPFHWYLKWGAVLFVAVIAGGGYAYYWFVQRHRTGVLAAHRLEPATAPAATSAPAATPPPSGPPAPSAEPADG